MKAARSGESWAVIAASEQGKGLWIKSKLRGHRPQRLLIWDRVGEYGGFALRVASLAELSGQLRRSERFKLRYVPRGTNDAQIGREFDAFCKVAFLAAGAWVLVEELSDVTKPSFAPASWRRLNSQGRHHQGLTIIGTSQSPAMIDKTFLANATLLHVGFLGTHAHRKAVAVELDCRPEEIRSLARGEWIELDRATRRLSHGSVKIPATATASVTALPARRIA